MEREIKKIADFCKRRKTFVSFYPTGVIRIAHGKESIMEDCSAKELDAEINKDDQRRCHEELVAWNNQQFAPPGSPLDKLLKASVESLAQTTEKNDEN